MEKRLTDNEIVKALECLEKDTNCGDCAVIKQCKGDCVFTKALDLINRLQAENGIYETCNARKDEAIKHLEAEAYKEFAERLKEIATQGFWETDAYVGAKQIDNLLKEIIGE